MHAELPLIIEVRVNETAYRGEGRERLPYSTQEIVDDACRAAEAGATILHWHCRDAETGKPRNDPHLFHQVIEGVRRRCDMLFYPTLGHVKSPVEERIAHVLSVQADPATRVDLVPVDFGSMNLDAWNVAERSWRTQDRVYANPRMNLTALLERFNALSLRVAAVCWDIGHVRTARRYVEMGLLRDPLWELAFTGVSMPSGAGPTPAALQALREELGPNEPWLVLCWHGDVMRIAASAISLGGHVAIGLGDWPYQRFAGATNALLTAKVVELARTLDRPVATVDEARRALGISRVGAPV